PLAVATGPAPPPPSAPSPSQVATLSAPSLVAALALEQSSPPVSREQPVHTPDAEEPPPDSMRAWGFATSPPAAPPPVAKTVPAPGVERPPSVPPDSIRSWTSP